MDFTYILRRSVPETEKLKALGFIESENELKYRISLEASGFYAEFTVSADSFSAEVYDSATGEKYALLDVPKARGAFVGGLRSELTSIAERIEKECFTSSDIKTKFVEHLKARYSVQPDFPWNDLPDYAVFRCKNGKWFALVMKIKFKNLGIPSEEPVWVVNMKADAEKIPQIVDHKSIFPAYHMSKKYWITVLLTAVTDFEVLCGLAEESRSLVQGRLEQTV